MNSNQRLQTWMVGGLSLIQEADEFNEKDRSATIRMEFQPRKTSNADQEGISPIGMRELGATDMDFSRDMSFNIRLSQPKLSTDMTNSQLMDVSGIHGGNIRLSNFVDDSHLINLIEMNETGINLNDIGEIEEEDKQFLIIDKDTGKAYDVRNETHVEKITKKTVRIT